MMGLGSLELVLAPPPNYRRVKTQQEGNNLQAKKRVLIRT